MAAFKSILVTGGTGSFGQAFVQTLLDRHPEVERIVVYSRDELKQYEMAQKLGHNRRGLRFFIGDIRDQPRLRRALEGVDVVVHAAALKQVPAAEYNPFECIKTNVLGAENLVEACLDSDVRRVIALSTDKAAAPINLYGATKLCSDKLITAANNVRGNRDLRFAVVRYGNVLGSRGSVIPFFLSCRESGVLPITHPEMTRFNITLQEGVDMVLWAIENSLGGEIFVPRIPSYRIVDVAEAVDPACERRIVGIRPGEKLHEEMITASDSYNTVDLGRYFAILSSSGEHSVDAYLERREGMRAEPGFSYCSGTNDRFLSVAEIRELIRANIGPLQFAEAAE
jgi:UDP-N-acetylglucosamine 4,6-dehydratase (inverting)